MVTTAPDRHALLREYTEGGAKRAILDAFLVSQEIDAIKSFLVLKRDLEATGRIDPRWLIFSTDDAEKQKSVLLLDHDNDVLCVDGLVGKAEGILMRAARRRSISIRNLKRDLLSMR